MTGLLSHPLDLGAVAAGGLLLLTALVWLAKAGRRATRAQVATAALVVPAAMALALSASTSYRFAGRTLGITDVAERMGLCGVAEALILGFTAHSWATKSKGSAWTAYAIVVVQAVPAFSVSGGAGGIVRIVLGPIALAVTLHRLLGIEAKLSGTVSNGLLASAAREIRERITARLGIGRRGADSAEIARSRAADRAVALASRRKLGRFAAPRLAKAIDAARHGLPEDDAARAEASIVGRVVRRKSVADLHNLTARHQWLTPSVSIVEMIEPRVEEIAGPDTTEDTDAPAEPVIAEWTGARVSGPRRHGRRPRHLRPARTSQAPQTVPEQPQPVSGPVQADTSETEPETPAQGGKRRLPVRPAVLALRAQYPDMPTDTIAGILGVAERTVTRNLSAKDTQIQHANGTTLTALTEGN